MENIVSSALIPYTQEAAWLDVRLHPRQGNGAAQQGVLAGQAAPVDRVEVSPEARRLAEANGAGKKEDQSELTEEEKSEVRDLQKRDRQVRAHEQAHLAAAAGLARSGAKFEYESGPDGKRYAVGGEVDIDTSAEEGDPQATIRKAQRIRRAAMAPADPSAQDRRVAAEAAAMAVKAQQELNQQNGAQTEEGKTGQKVNLAV